MGIPALAPVGEAFIEAQLLSTEAIDTGAYEDAQARYALRSEDIVFPRNIAGPIISFASRIYSHAAA